ncbi:MAG TPA: hypothetical protein VLD38_01830 [Nitrosopumilaceae archaeon]|nr:hypothetical protein [Nitrosopumilaceae archaeon]
MKIINRRGRNWFTAMGVLFIVVASITIIRNLIIWGPEFVWDFFLSNEITNEKVSAAMIFFGVFLLYLGFRKMSNETR